jgi:dihydrofolate reductase
MRKLILKMSISIDGFVGGPNSQIDWIFKSMNENVEAWVVESLWQAGVHIMGSRTYYDMISYWPTSTEPIAAPMNAIPKVVFSKKGDVDVTSGLHTTPGLQDAMKQRPVKPPAAENLGNWADTRVAAGDLKEEILKLKNESGKDILAHGGAGFAKSLVGSGLVDEYQLLVHPVALGTGLPLFAALRTPLDLRLIRVTTFPDSGVLGKIYTPPGNDL